MNFALNHLCYFLLTHLVMPSLTAAAPARIVNVASAAHKGRQARFRRPAGRGALRPLARVQASKLANMMFTYGSPAASEGRGMTVNALHPGFVATDIGVRHGFVPNICGRSAS